MDMTISFGMAIIGLEHLKQYVSTGGGMAFGILGILNKLNRFEPRK